MGQWKLQTAADYSNVDTLSTLKTYMKVSDSNDDTIITDLMKSAARMIERRTQRYFLTQTWDYFLDRFQKNLNRPVSNWWNGVQEGAKANLFLSTNAAIELNKGPVQSITSIFTFNTNNESTEFDSSKYRLDDSSDTARIYLNEGNEWPSDSLRDVNAYRVRVVVGYEGAPEGVPEDFLLALRKQVMHMYDNRAYGEMSMSKDVEEIIEKYESHAGLV